MKKIVLTSILLGLVLTGCASTEAQLKKYSDVAQANQMVPREQNRFDFVLQRHYEVKQSVPKVYIANLNLENVEIVENYDDRYTPRRDWELTGKDIKGLQEFYQEAMTYRFSNKNGYERVSSAKQADLVVHAKIERMAPLAPKDDNRSRNIGANYYTEGSGEVTIIFDVYQQDQLVLKIEDTRDAGFTWKKNDRLNNRTNMRNLFQGWAKDLAKLV